MIKRQALLPILLLALVCCNEESPPSSEFIIISNAGSPPNGIVSTYSYPSKIVKDEVFRFSSTNSGATVSDAILSDNDLFVLKRDDSPGPDKFEVVNTSNWGDFLSTNLSLVASFSRIAIYQNKAFVAGSSLDGNMHLLVFNKTTLIKQDSIFLREYVEIRKMIVHADKIFISYNYVDSNAKLLILSAKTFEELDEIDLPENCEDLLVDLDGNVLAFYRQGFLKINSSTLESTPVAIPFGNVFYGPGGSSFGFDRKKNTIYYFAYAPQPAPALFYLAAFNLSTGLPLEIPDAFIDASSINFNNSIGKIIMGARDPNLNQGIVRLCDKSGNVLTDFVVPNTPIEILYK